MKSEPDTVSAAEPASLSGLSTVDPTRIPPPPQSPPGTGSTDHSFRLPPGYRFLRQLGSGGSGLVLAAVQETLGREVAVKILNHFAPRSAVAGERFKAEATVIARLRHPGVVQVYEAGEYRDHPYIVMELVRGGTLEERIARSPLSVTEAAGCLKQVADAVEAAHQAGILHRDLKPSNVLLEAGLNPATADASPPAPPAPLVPKIADFGLAKDLTDTVHTTTNAVMGTPCYMAPEQANGALAAVGPRTDVYGLGAVLYACLTGHPPFRGTTLMETLDLVRSAEPVSPRAARPALPRDLETICLKCLRKPPAERYQSAKELAADLDRFLEGKPILARPVGPATRFVKWCRRQPAVAALMALAVLLPVVGTVAVSVHNADLNQALADQTRERQRADDNYKRADENYERAEDNFRDARLAIKRADENFKRADDNYREARLAIKKMLARTSESSAVPIPQLRDLERKQAEDALTFFRSVVREEAESDPEVRYQLAEAIYQLGVRTTETGDPVRAVELYREALAIFDALQAASPSNVPLRSSRAMAHGQSGFALLGSNPAKAETELRTAAELFAALLADHPDVAEYAHREGQFTHNLGTLRRRAGKLKEADELYQKAIDAHERGMKIQPPSPLRRVMLSDSLIGKGLVAWQLKRFAEAEQAYQRAHEQLSLSLAQHPDDIDCLLSLGTLHINWGLVASEADWPELAVTRLRKAVELLEGLYQREPKLVRLRLPLYNALGATHTELAKQNQFVEAARLAARQALFARPDQVCANWGNSAKYWALAGNKTECLAAATKARETSGNAWPTFWASWSTDPAFNPYRESEEWKKLGP